MKLNSAAQLLDEKGKNDSTDQIMFADSMGIQIDSSKMVDTKDGLLVKDAIICRAMVLDYNGKKILKSPETLADSMSTMQRMMRTDEHPRSGVIMDVLEIKGRVLPGTVILNNNVATGDLLITDKVLADEIKNGKRDLSPGYYADIIEEPGKFNDEPYQAVQKKVLYDHLEVVKVGRCSRPKCSILDSAVSNDLVLFNDGILRKRRFSNGMFMKSNYIFKNILIIYNLYVYPVKSGVK